MSLLLVRRHNMRPSFWNSGEDASSRKLVAFKATTISSISHVAIAISGGAGGVRRYSLSSSYLKHTSATSRPVNKINALLTNCVVVVFCVDRTQLPISDISLSY